MMVLKQNPGYETVESIRGVLSSRINNHRDCWTNRVIGIKCAPLKSVMAMPR